MRSDKIVSNGKPKTIRSVAQTVEEALEKAEGDLPNDAEVIDKKVYLSPDRKEFMIEALDEQDVGEKTKERIGNAASLKSVELVSLGRKGMFGIGHHKLEFNNKNPSTSLQTRLSTQRETARNYKNALSIEI